MGLTTQIAHSIHELDPTEWDRLSNGRPFQSHRWYVFGERVMGDCPPIYLIIREGDRALARAALWFIREEPLRLPRRLQAGLHSVFRHYPLLICRSPLADTSGLLLPEGPTRREAHDLLIVAARRELRRQRGSFLLFDFLDGDRRGWPREFKSITIDAPGTRMDLQWPTFEMYLDQRNHRGRWHYRKSMEEAQGLGLTLSQHSNVNDVNAAQTLIENVFQKHGAPFNPWMRPLLENLGLVDSTWLEVHQGDKLVGCAAALRDERGQLGTALGLEKDVSYAYFLLIYAILQDAFKHNIELVRLGSGAYEFKHRLGFTREDNNHLVLTGANPMSQFLVQLAAR